MWKYGAGNYLKRVSIWIWMYLHPVNPKQVNTLDIEWVKKIPWSSMCWCVSCCYWNACTK